MKSHQEQQQQNEAKRQTLNVEKIKDYYGGGSGG